MDILEDTIENYDDTIYGGVQTTFGSVLSTEFKPWHKPRKQWIRENQWASYVKKLFSTNLFKDIDVINYFSLPGEDCLDIKTIGKKLPEGKTLKYLGVETKKLQRQTINDRKLHDLEYISSDSKILVNTNFEDLAQENTNLTYKILYGAPFHVVNIDLTNSIFAPHHAQNTWNALCRLLQNQFEKQQYPWLLFITTRCDKLSVDPVFFAECLKVLFTNYENECFREKFNEKIHKTNTNIKLSNENLCQDFCFEPIAIIVLIKMILNNAIHMSVKMQIPSIVEYSVEDDCIAHPDMISMVIEFRKKPIIRDVNGIASRQSEALDEVSLATKYIEKVVTPFNIDNHLEKNNEIKQKMVNITKDMLKELGYDITQYCY